MRNILRMNLYRLKKSRMLPVICIICAGLMALLFGVDWLVNRIITMDSFVFSSALPRAVNVFDSVRSVLSSAFIPILTVVFTLLFFHADVSTGFAKNLIGYCGKKEQLVGANTLITVIVGAGLTGIALIVGGGLTVLCNDALTYTGGWQFVGYLIVTFAEMLAFVMLLTWVSDLGGKAIVMMIFGIIYLMYHSLIYQLIELGCDYFFSWQVTVGKYTLLGGFTTLSADSTVEDMALLFGIAVVLFALFFYLDARALEKRELK